MKKNLKSKFLVPAIALIGLSTAASISGSVAWFTANRTTKITAGEFAVIKSGDNLKIALTEGVGNKIVGTDTVRTLSGYKLTDASFDHTYHDTAVPAYSSWTAPYVVEPNNPRDKIEATYALGSGGFADGMVRENISHVYSAFTWNITFTIEFSESSNYDQGLFLDLDSDDTYMHEVIDLPTDHSFDPANLPAGSWFTDADLSTAAQPTADHFYHYTATQEDVDAGTSADGWYDNDGCTEASTGTMTLGGDYYKKSYGGKLYKAAPNSTGKAFRIAFIPTGIGGTGANQSEAYAKVWADNEGTTNDGTLYEGQHVMGNADDALTPDYYSENTLALTGNASSSSYSSAVAGTAAVLEPATPAVQKVYMNSSDTDTEVPADNTITAANALKTKCNYLGLFKLDKGKTVTLTYTCVAWYEGSHPEIDSLATDFENIVTSMRFTVANLSNE